MRALVFDETLQFAERPYQALPGECLVRVILAGICNTDLEITAGYMGFTGVLGHEFVGVVVRGPDELLDKRVVGEINVGCGECAHCRQGLERHCASRTVLGIAGRDGAMADALSLPAKNLHLVPETVSDVEATFVEPLAAACEILEQVHLDPSARICLIGDGKLAILIGRVLACIGAAVTVVGKHPEKMVKIPAQDRIEAHRFAPARSFDIVIEASGHPSGWQTALQAVRPRGTIVLKSTYAGGFEFNPAPLVIDEITVVGSRCGRFAPALRLLADGKVRVEDLVSAIYPFDQALEAFAAARSAETIKVLVGVS